MMKKFTPYEANQTLPLVRKIVEDILAKAQEFRTMTQGKRARAANKEAQENIKSDISELLAELEQIGCSFKDWNFELGLVDFPSHLDGQDVSLCWRSDEPYISWYHDSESGYAGRKPIPDALLKEVLSEQRN